MNKKSKDIHIVHVVESLDWEYGGPAQSIPLLAKESKSLGAKITFVSGNWNTAKQNNDNISNIKCNWIKLKTIGPSKIRYAPALYKILSKIAKDPYVIIHVHNLWNFFPFTAYRVIKKNKKCKLVVSLRGSMSDWAWSQRSFVKKIAWYTYQKAMLNNASCIHATSKDEEDFARKRGVYTPIKIIPNGVDLKEFKNLPKITKAQNFFGLSHDFRYVLFISRFHPIKGLEELVNAWSQLPKELLNRWKLLLIGGTGKEKYEIKIQKKVSSLHIDKSVIFYGYLPKRNRLYAYAASHVFVLPSHSENFGIAVLEALAAGLPVITTTATPWKRIEKDGAGYCIELSVPNLAVALKKMLSNEGAHKKMSISSLKIANEFDWHNIGKKFHAVYEKVLSNRM